MNGQQHLLLPLLPYAPAWQTPPAGKWQPGYSYGTVRQYSSLLAYGTSTRTSNFFIPMSKYPNEQIAPLKWTVNPGKPVALGFQYTEKPTYDTVDKYKYKAGAKKVKKVWGLLNRHVQICTIISNISAPHSPLQAGRLPASQSDPPPAPQPSPSAHARTPRHSSSSVEQRPPAGCWFPYGTRRSPEHTTAAAAPAAAPPHGW